MRATVAAERAPLGLRAVPTLPHLLLILALLAAPSISTPPPACNVSTPSPLNSFGCLLFSFAAYNATRNASFSLSFATIDAVAQPNTLILSSLSPVPAVLVHFLNSTFHTQLAAPFTLPTRGAVDSGGSLFLLDILQDVFVFSPYPAYAWTGQLLPTTRQYGLLVLQARRASTCSCGT